MRVTHVPFQSLEDKFAYHLEEAYYVENQLVTVLDDLIAEVNDDGLRNALEHHREETEDHVENVDQVFELIDREPQGREVPTFDALVEEHDRLHEEADGDPHMQDLCVAGIALKNEHMEIATYESLIALDKQLDTDRPVRNALEANLDDEKDAKKLLKATAEDSTLGEIFAKLTG